MTDVAVTAILGVFLVVLGVQNRKGNIGSLHWYHRRRVTEENRLPFGKLVGLGTVLCGVGLLLYGGFSFLSALWSMDILVLIGSALLILCLAAGLGLTFYAMFKYNKGIF